MFSTSDGWVAEFNFNPYSLSPSPSLYHHVMIIKTFRVHLLSPSDMEFLTRKFKLLQQGTGGSVGKPVNQQSVVDPTGNSKEGKTAVAAFLQRVTSFL